MQCIVPANLVTPQKVSFVALWYFCQCSEVEYTEIVIFKAWTGGLGWSRKDYEYEFNIFKVGRCELNPVQSRQHSLSF